MNPFVEHYPVLKSGAYLMNAAVGGIHQKTAKAMESSINQTLNKAAIQDIRFFNLLEETREVAARFLNLAKEDIGIGSNTSMNMNLFALMLKDEGFKKVIAPAVEFPSSTLPWFHHGYEVELVHPVDGVLREDDLLKKMNGEKCLIVCSGVQYLTGQKMNLKYLSNKLLETSSELIINATQEIGQFPIDLREIDYLGFSASTHKWLGADLGLSLISVPSKARRKYKMPIGGWTSVEEPWELENKPPHFLSDMGAFQVGCLPFNSLAGLKMAMEVQEDIGLALISKRVLENSNLLEKAIKNQGYELISPREPLQKSGICTFNFEGNLDLALESFMKNDVFVNGRKGSIRASIHFYNSEKDVVKFEEALKLI